MTDTSVLEAALVDLSLGPGKGGGVGVVGLDEGIDVLPELGDGYEGCAAERPPSENGEPDFDLVEPGGAGRREVEVDIGMRCQPCLIPLVGIEVVKDGMDLLVRIEGHDVVHEGKELDAPAALLVGGGHLARGQIERGKQCRGAVPLVVVTVAAERAPVGQLEVALRRSSAWMEGFSLNAQDDRLVGAGPCRPTTSAALAANSGSSSRTTIRCCRRSYPVPAQEAPYLLLV